MSNSINYKVHLNEWAVYVIKQGKNDYSSAGWRLREVAMESGRVLGKDSQQVYSDMWDIVRRRCIALSNSLGRALTDKDLRGYKG